MKSTDVKKTAIVLAVFFALFFVVALVFSKQEKPSDYFKIEEQYERISSPELRSEEGPVEQVLKKFSLLDKSKTENRALTEQPERVLKILKDVGEPMYSHFGLRGEDFVLIREAGFDVIAGNFDICASYEDVQFFLDSARAAGLAVILNAGSGEAEWGYECGGEPFSPQKPVWQKQKVVAWVNEWKKHPALFAWDTSNEAGANFPFGSNSELALTLEQLEQAYRDVKQADPGHDVLIRMNGWHFYDNDSNFFRAGNPFGKNVADIVMINAYSNVEDYYDDFVGTVASRATHAIAVVEPNMNIIVALGAWQELPLWYKPLPLHLKHDYEQAIKNNDLFGVAFFKYGAWAGNDWYLPHKNRGSHELWSLIILLNATQQAL
jgi:hypothetical protein